MAEKEKNLSEKKTNIVLIGLRGSGKSFVGIELAKKLNKNFFDSDELIEKKLNKKISEIFKDYGESFFRKKEADLINFLSKKKNAVISCGGGVVLNESNMKALQKNGVIFFLSVDPKKAWKRIKKDLNRPQLTKFNAEKDLEETLRKRKRLYNKYSDFFIDVNSSNLKRKAIQIKELFLAVKGLKKFNYKVKEEKTDIFIGENLSSLIVSELIKENYSKTLIVTDSVIKRLYLNPFTKLLKENQIPFKVFSIKPGEQSKSFSNYKKLIEFAFKERLDRNSCILGFGGGVVNDLANFTASTYMRGIDFLSNSTTLLSVDSSIGGKNGINLSSGKNIIGTITQPKKIFFDIDFFSTLPDKEIRNGLAEIIKQALVFDSKTFSFIERNAEKIKKMNSNALIELIEKSIKIKAQIIEKDSNEKGLRKILNLGHTLGHAIESFTKYKKYSHGEAIVMGMNYSFKLSEKLGLMNENQTKRILELFKKFNLNYFIPALPIEKLIFLMSKDKKAEKNTINFTLLSGIGKAHSKGKKFVVSVEKKTLIEAWKELAWKEFK
ncbi:MAG TPA: 3-dehydroquinate synthase [archaeon]|nr:3-dehydroquinate synthase [archaeon]